MNQMSRDEIEALLVFYANGTLDGDERDAVEAALEGDSTLRADLQHLIDFRAEMQSTALRDPGDLAFKKLMNEVDQTPQNNAADIPSSNSPKWPVSRWVAVAAVLALAVQTIVFWQSTTTGYELASGDNRSDVIVAFQPAATENDIRILLLELDLEIVSGPSSLGLYGLSSEQPAFAVDALTANPDVVESAQHAND